MYALSLAPRTPPFGGVGKLRITNDAAWDLLNTWGTELNWATEKSLITGLLVIV